MIITAYTGSGDYSSQIKVNTATAETTGTGPTISGSTMLDNAETNIVLGASRNAGGSFYFGKIGEVIRFNRVLDSTEQATLKLEVYKGNKLVDIINGDPTLADPGRVTEVVAYFIPKSLGEFNLQGSVSFGGKFTNVVQSDITVELGLTIILLIVIIPLAILLVVILIWLKKRRSF